MKNLFIVVAVVFGVHSVGYADQAATLSCVGKNVVLEVRSPYFGENSIATQELYVLKSKDLSSNESAYTAYFLDVELDIGGVRHGGTGTLVYTGKNEVGGKFQMIISPWEDVGEGTVVRQISRGKISYHHGPLKGKDEPVSCVLD